MAGPGCTLARACAYGRASLFLGCLIVSFPKLLVVEMVLWLKLFWVKNCFVGLNVSGEKLWGLPIVLGEKRNRPGRFLGGRYEG